MSPIEKKSYSRDFKLQAVNRLEAGESSRALSEELGMKRTKFYRWRDIVRRDGEKAFPGHWDRRSKAEVLAREHGAEGATELAHPRRKIAELERRSSSAFSLSDQASTPASVSRAAFRRSSAEGKRPAAIAAGSAVRFADRGRGSWGKDTASLAQKTGNRYWSEPYYSPVYYSAGHQGR